MFCSRLWGGGKNLKVSDPIISEFSLSSDRHSSWMGLVFSPALVLIYYFSLVGVLFLSE